MSRRASARTMCYCVRQQEGARGRHDAQGVAFTASTCCVCHAGNKFHANSRSQKARFQGRYIRLLAPSSPQTDNANICLGYPGGLPRFAC